MSARETIRNVLLVHYANSPDPTLTVDTLMANARAELPVEDAERVRLAIVSTLNSGQGTAHHLPLGTLTVLAERLTQALVPVACSPIEADTSFFQPGHVYIRDHHGHRIEFTVEHVATAPSGGYRVAFGWRNAFGRPEEPFDSDDLDGWTDVTETGEG